MGPTDAYRFPFAKFPAVRIAFLLAGGIIASSFSSFSLAYAVGLFLICASGFLWIEFGLSERLDPWLHKTSVTGYLLMIFLFGVIIQSINQRADRPASADILQAYRWEQIGVKGTVYNIKPTSTGKYQLDMNVDTTTFGDTLHWHASYNLRTVLDLALPPNLKLGSKVNLTATVYPLEERRNPHEFNYKGYLKSQNIFTHGGVESIHSIRNPDNLFSWNNLRQGVLDLIDQNFDTSSQSLAKALLIGYKNELDREDKIAFSRAGLSHIMAVSGLHVGFIIAPFWFLIPWFWTLKYGKQTGLVLLILLLLFYAGLTGFSASVCRASLTGGFITYGKLFHKIRDSMNLTAVAAIILLLINPSELFMPGFQLSFSAVYIILLIIPVINRWLPDWIQYRWYGTPLMVVIVSLIVQVGLFPLLTYHFGEFSLIGPIANAVVVPWLGVVVPYALFLLSVTIFFPVVGALLNIPNEWFLNGLNSFIQWASTLEWSWIQIHVDSPLIFMIWIAAIFVISTLYIPRLRWKMLALFLMLLVMQSSTRLVQHLGTSELKITIFDVGQGDAALISTPRGRHFLIDTGRWTPAYNSARYIILPHLKAEGIDKLDAVFLSHPHADHIGGTVELINSIPIDTIYNSGYNYDSNLYQNYHKAAARKSIPVKSLKGGTIIPLDPSIMLLAYGPLDRPFGADPNDHSLILELIYGETEFLFVGDAEKGQERRLLQRYAPLMDTDFLKVGHHGSRTSSSEQFLDTATPAFSVVSLAKSNQFRHPHPEAVRRINNHSSRTYYTSLQKAVIFVSDGTNIRRIKW